MAQISQSRRKNTFCSLLLFFGSLSISFLAAEVILRIFGHHGAPQLNISNIHPVDDPILDWRYVPNSEFKLGNVVYRYNNHGFRDINYVVEKPRGITRMVVLGDSVSEGAGVKWQSVFAQIVQSQLGDKFEVINIAAGGLNTPQEIHLLEQEGLRYKPDLVILNFVLNDCDFYSNYNGTRRYEAEKDAKIGLLNLSIDPRIKRLLKSSAVIYFVKERVEDLKGRLSGVEETDYFTNIWGKDENRQKVANGFDKLMDLQSKAHFDVVVIVWPLITDYGHYKFGFVHQWVKEQAENRGFTTIDLLPSFSKTPYRHLQVTAEDNVHPNALGHKIAAEVFLTWYRSHYEGILGHLPGSL